jgi:hypothetical protein
MSMFWIAVWSHEERDESVDRSRQLAEKIEAISPWAEVLRPLRPHAVDVILHAEPDGDAALADRIEKIVGCKLFREPAG